jgi:hypothetical protein
MRRIMLLLIIASVMPCISCTKQQEAKKSDSVKIVANNKESEVVSSDMGVAKEINDADFSVFNKDSSLELKIYGNISTIEQILGAAEPGVVYESKDNPNGTILKNKWKSVYVEWLKSNGTILRIIIDANDYHTTRGISIGDSLSRIDSLYGATSGHKINNKIEFDLGNAENESMMALIFYHDGSHITKIEIAQGT